MSLDPLDIRALEGLIYFLCGIGSIMSTISSMASRENWNSTMP